MLVGTAEGAGDSGGVVGMDGDVGGDVDVEVVWVGALVSVVGLPGPGFIEDGVVLGGEEAILVVGTPRHTASVPDCTVNVEVPSDLGSEPDTLASSIVPAGKSESHGKDDLFVGPRDR